MAANEYCILLTITALCLSMRTLARQAEPTSSVMLQAFNWQSATTGERNWYMKINNKAAEIANLFDYVWLPPPSDSLDLQGYLPRRLEKLDSHYGNRSELRICVQALRSRGVGALADIVINHRVGTNHWADFTEPIWGCEAVTAGDEWAHHGGSPCGANDTGKNYEGARDVDHTNMKIRTSLVSWMTSLKKDIGFAGWRFDYVKGYSPEFNKLYVEATKPKFCIGELWTGFNESRSKLHRKQLSDWITAAGDWCAAFDFTTKGILHQAMSHNRRGILGDLPGLLGVRPTFSVTFLENHDTAPPQALWPFPEDHIMEGYAYILTHPGYPMVFWDHVYDRMEIQNSVSTLIRIRKNYSITANSSIDVKVAADDTYAAIIDGNVAVRLGKGAWLPGDGWRKLAAGKDYLVWATDTVAPDQVVNSTNDVPDLVALGIAVASASLLLGVCLCVWWIRRHRRQVLSKPQSYLGGSRIVGSSDTSKDAVCLHGIVIPDMPLSENASRLEDTNDSGSVGYEAGQHRRVPSFGLRLSSETWEEHHVEHVAVGPDEIHDCTWNSNWLCCRPSRLQLQQLGTLVESRGK